MIMCEQAASVEGTPYRHVLSCRVPRMQDCYAFTFKATESDSITVLIKVSHDPAIAPRVWARSGTSRQDKDGNWVSDPIEPAVEKRLSEAALRLFVEWLTNG